MEVQVELGDSSFKDTIKDLEAVEKKLEHALQSTLNIHAQVHLVEPVLCPVLKGKQSVSLITGIYKEGFLCLLSNCLFL